MGTIKAAVKSLRAALDAYAEHERALAAMPWPPATPPEDHPDLVEQARDLAVATPLSFESIRRLQRGLVRSEDEEEGAPLTRDEVLESVPILVDLHIRSGGAAEVGRAMRGIKAMKLLEDSVCQSGQD